MPRLSKIGAACLAAFGWTSGAAAVSASYLVVAGGGGGGGAAGTASGGGGGAGGLLTGTTTLNTTLSYTVVVGAGASSAGIQGSNSVFNAITSTGGGLGGRGIQNGGNGGSGGGSCGQASGAGLGTAGQGNNGGVGSGFGYTGGGGGGGAGAAGGNADGSSLGGPGGNGSASSISGTSVTYAGGGGGGTNFSTTQQAGGTGGGGIGGSTSSVVGGNGTANLGAGGGGGGSTSSAVGGNGGSGVVIISYPSPQKFGGGIVTESGGNTIHTFQTSGTLSPLSSLTASYLIVAGGAGTCGRGGAGAGGLLSGSSLTIDTNSIYLVTVGAGGTGTAGGSTASAVGGNSAFSMVTTTAVGGGSGGTTANTNGASGGSGGGGTVGTGTGGAGTAGQGNAGGNGGAFSGNFTSGGGGGAGAAGQAGQVGAGGAGGVGVSSSISGTATFYAGGGGGHADTSASGVGGNGGGGAGALGDANGTNGTANTGGGAGGSNPTTKFAQGGSGVVIISYPGSTQLMAGGTVTVAGGNVIHTFTSSGYLTPLTLVGNSLRFRASATGYLSRTPSVAGNRQTWTYSAWIKRGTVSAEGTLISGGATTGRLAVFFNSSGNLVSDVGGTGTYDQSVAVYRDPAAWYHFVWQFDTTQATAANRSRMYINGVQISLTQTRTFDQNTNYEINNSTLQTLGTLSNSIGTFNLDGYQTEVQFIDGQALTPNSFGTFNSFGVWQPIVYGGSYGTNGFYLPFTNTGTISASYLVVAGGGGGGSDASNGTQAGGGGAGGYLTSTVTLPINGAFTVTVGGGGTGGTGSNSGSDGSDSVLSGAGISTITSTGGGRGGSRNTNSANSGGSGGGGAPSSIGTGTVGQGNDGGTGNTTGGGGGGGAGAVGGSTTAPDGGIGLQSSISGTATYYAGGGGGRSGSSPFTQGTGGLGGGGAYGNAGTTNTGGGGGGGGGAGGKDGGSGIVIISYAGSQRFTGGTITSSGGNTIHTFTASGTLGVGIAADYSPQGNNWTPNNISLTLGSTYDSMTDVPTLTSTTAANYCVLNPLSSGSFNTISNANLKVAGNTSTNNGNTRSTIYFTTGKWYIEMTAGATSASVYPSSGIIPASNAGSPDNGGTNQVGYPANSVSYEISGNKRIANSTSSYGSTYTTGDVIGIAIDADNGAIYFSKNGTFQNSGVPTSGGSKTGAAFTWTGGSIEYAFATAQYDGSDGSFNFGQQPFTYTPPSGFLPLNTFNL
jgi:hypothetical protein